MRAFILTFDYTVLKHAKLLKLQEQIKKDENILSWWHHLNGTYILLTKDHVTADKVREFFQHYFPNEHCLVLRVKYSDYNGWLPEEAWGWMESSLKMVQY